MLSLESFLSAAPKSTLATFRTHWKLAPGSVVSSKVVEEAVRSRAFDAGRLRPLFERLTPAQRDVLCAIYGADDRGVGEEELREAFSSAERPLLDETVEEFRREMVVARTADGRLMGFAELWPDLSDLFADAAPRAERPEIPPVSYEAFAAQHLLRLFSFLVRAPWHYTREGNINQNDRKDYDTAYRFGRQLSPRLFTETVGGKASPGLGEELALLLDLCVRLGWVVCADGELRLHVSGLEAARRSCRELWTAMIDCWISSRGTSRETLRTALQTLIVPRQARPWSKLLTLRERLGASRRLEWDGLPRALRELILLGLVEPGMDRSGAVLSLGLTHSGRAWCESGELPPEQPLAGYAMSNFEVMVPVAACGPHVWVLHRICDLCADENMMRFRISESRVLESLRLGLAPNEVRAAAEWLKLPPHVAQRLEEWLQSFERCRFLRPLLLEVRDRRLREKLMACAPVAEWVREEIEGYGLLLRDGAEEALPPLLTMFGLHPSPLRAGEGAVSAAPRPESAPKAKPAPQADYSWTEEPARRSLRLGELDFASAKFSEIDPGLRLRYLDHCADRRAPLTVWTRDRSGRALKLKLVAQGRDDLFFDGADEKGRTVRLKISEIVNVRL